MRLLPTNCHTD